MLCTMLSGILGYYRINYDPRNWKLILQYLQTPKNGQFRNVHSIDHI